MAWRFAEAGCKLVLLARRQDRLESLRDQLIFTYHVPVHTVILDVRNVAEVDLLPGQLPEEFADVGWSGVCSKRLRSAVWCRDWVCGTRGYGWVCTQAAEGIHHFNVTADRGRVSNGSISGVHLMSVPWKLGPMHPFRWQAGWHLY